MDTNRKDVVLTVAGVLASMVVAYLIYRMERSNSLAIQQATEAAANAAQQAANAAQQTSSTAQPYTAPSISVPSITEPTYSPQSTGEDQNSVDSNNFLDNVLSAFMGSNSNSSYINGAASLLIPQTVGINIAGDPGVTLGGQSNPTSSSTSGNQATVYTPGTNVSTTNPNGQNVTFTVDQNGNLVGTSGDPTTIATTQSIASSMPVDSAGGAGSTGTATNPGAFGGGSTNNTGSPGVSQPISTVFGTNANTTPSSPTTFGGTIKL